MTAHDGADGANCADGADGAEGADGADGADGTRHNQPRFPPALKMCSSCKKNRAIDEYEEGYLCCIQCVGYKRKYNERHKEKVNQTQRK